MRLPSCLYKNLFSAKALSAEQEFLWHSRTALTWSHARPRLSNLWPEKPFGAARQEIFNQMLILNYHSASEPIQWCADNSKYNYFCLSTKFFALFRKTTPKVKVMTFLSSIKFVVQILFIMEVNSK